MDKSTVTAPILKRKQASLTRLQMAQAFNEWQLAELLRSKGILVDGVIIPKIKFPYKQFYNVKTDMIIIQQVQYV